MCVVFTVVFGVGCHMYVWHCSVRCVVCVHVREVRSVRRAACGTWRVACRTLPIKPRRLLRYFCTTGSVNWAARAVHKAPSSVVLISLPNSEITLET